MDDALRQLFIPDRISVGFQERKDTYTGKLAYVIYYDQKGVRRKELSWQSWRSDKIDPQDFDNKPMAGFVLNKGVGGVRQSYGHNARNEYIRVYDPRDFEFEISLPNLLFILRECDCSRGKGLEGEFVYAWDKADLVLLPTSGVDYQNSQKFTQLKGQRVKSKEMIPGATYITKTQKSLIYVGHFDYYYMVDARYGNLTAADQKGCAKKHVFWGDDQFVYHNDLSKIGECTSASVVSDYAELVDRYNRSPHGSRVVRLFLKPTDKPIDAETVYNSRHKHTKDLWFREEEPGKFSVYTTFYGDGGHDVIRYIEAETAIGLSDEAALMLWDSKRYMYPPDAAAPKPSSYDQHTYYRSGRFSADKTQRMKWSAPEHNMLYAEMENGQELRVTREFTKDSNGYYFYYQW